MTLDRFRLLGEVYDNDIDRLDALAEGGAALLAGARAPVPNAVRIRASAPQPWHG